MTRKQTRSERPSMLASAIVDDDHTQAVLRAGEGVVRALIARKSYHVIVCWAAGQHLYQVEPVAMHEPVAMQWRYHVTLVRDAPAAFTEAMMHAAHELDGPT